MSSIMKAQMLSVEQWKQEFFNPRKKGLREPFRPVRLDPLFRIPTVFAPIAKPCRWPNAGPLGQKLNRLLWLLRHFARLAVHYLYESKCRVISKDRSDLFFSNFENVNTFAGNCFVPGKKVISDWKELPRIKKELFERMDELDEDTVSTYMWSLIYFGDQQRQILLSSVGAEDYPDTPDGAAVLTNFDQGLTPLRLIYPEFCKNEVIGNFGEISSGLPSFLESMTFSVPRGSLKDLSAAVTCQAFNTADLWAYVENAKPMLRWICSTNPSSDQFEVFLAEAMNIMGYFEDHEQTNKSMNEYFTKESDTFQSYIGPDWFENLRELEKVTAKHPWADDNASGALLHKLWLYATRSMFEIKRFTDARFEELENRYFDVNEASISLLPSVALTRMIAAASKTAKRKDKKK